MAIRRQAVDRRALQQKRHDLGFVEDARDQLAVLQVIGGQRRFILVKAAIDFIHPIPGIINGFALAEQLAGDRLQRKRGEVPERGFQRLNAIDNQAAVGLSKEDAILKTVFAPLQFAVAAAEQQRDAIALGVLLQDA